MSTLKRGAVRGLVGALLSVGAVSIGSASNGCNTIRDPIVGVWNGEAVVTGAPATPGTVVLHSGGTGVYNDIANPHSSSISWKRTGMHTYQFTSTRFAGNPMTMDLPVGLTFASNSSNTVVPRESYVRVHTSGTAVTDAECRMMTVKGTTAYYKPEDVRMAQPLSDSRKEVTIQFVRGE